MMMYRSNDKSEEFKEQLFK